MRVIIEFDIPTNLPGDLADVLLWASTGTSIMVGSRPDDVPRLARIEVERE